MAYWAVYYICVLFSVTEDHPEVQAMVLTALEDAKHVSTSPFGLYAEVLEERIKEVCQKSETWQLHLNKLFGPEM